MVWAAVAVNKLQSVSIGQSLLGIENVKFVILTELTNKSNALAQKATTCIQTKLSQQQTFAYSAQKPLNTLRIASSFVGYASHSYNTKDVNSQLSDNLSIGQ